jgi:hypothetical protein
MGTAEVGGAGLLLWLSFFAGPAAWGIRLSGSYAVVAVACDWDLVGPLVLGLTGAEWLVLLLTAVTAVACLAAGVVGWGVWRRSGAGWVLGNNGMEARNGFLGLSGFLMNMFFMAVILLEGSAVFFLGVCD